MERQCGKKKRVGALESTKEVISFVQNVVNSGFASQLAEWREDGFEKC